MATRTNTKRKLTDEPELLLSSATLTPAELHEKITARAYEIFVARNGSAGDSTSDWLMAEHEICNSLPAPSDYDNNAVSITSVVTKRKQPTSSKPTTRRSSTPKASSPIRSQKQKEAKR
ncbi:MAG: DUF2934 domain-containing protein [Blastocatellia bacterium]